MKTSCMTIVTSSIRKRYDSPGMICRSYHPIQWRIWASELCSFCGDLEEFQLRRSNWVVFRYLWELSYDSLILLSHLIFFINFWFISITFVYWYFPSFKDLVRRCKNYEVEVSWSFRQHKKTHCLGCTLIRNAFQIQATK